jgi:hypothetical protein
MPKLPAGTLARVAALLSSIALLFACVPGTPASALLHAPEYNPSQQTKCQVSASQTRPLIVEWPAPDRASLEASVKQGVVVVRYASCEMEILTACRAKQGHYKFIRTNVYKDEVRIRDTDELYANLPLGAAKLEGRLDRGGQLHVAMSVAGTYQADFGDVTFEDLEGDCARATHVIHDVNVGAFDFYQEADAQIGAGFGGVVGAKSGAARETINTAGDAAGCASPSAAEGEPPPNCGALLRLTVTPIGRKAAVGAKPVGAVTDVASRIKVAVTCGDSDVLGAEQIETYVDEAPEPLSPVAVKKHFDESLGRAAVEYVSYATTPGSHTVRVASAGCAPATTYGVESRPEEAAFVRGGLGAQRPLLSATPASGLDGWRVGASFVSGTYFQLDPPTNVSPMTSIQVQQRTLSGVSFAAGYVGYFVAEVEGDANFGTATYTTSINNSFAAPTSTTSGASTLRAVARIGGRLPLAYGAFSGGLEGGYFQPSVDGLDLKPMGLFGGWLGLEIAPLCDFAFPISVDLAGTPQNGDFLPSDTWQMTVQLGAAFQPNSRCRRERAQAVGLQASAD